MMDEQNPLLGNSLPKNGRVSLTSELAFIVKAALPLMLGFLLQNSLTLASVMAVGRLGRDELAAASLATMTANLTAYSFYEGFCTALDTLCSQAWGSTQKQQVGLHLQRCVYQLALLTIPIGALWGCSPYILQHLVPEQRPAMLAGQYLRVLLFGTPGFFLFEAGKRFVQAQGVFHAGTSILLFLAPLNFLMNHLFVWNSHVGIGFLGAPMAIVITNWLMAISLWSYAFFSRCREGWGGFSREAFTRWGQTLRLALPGVVMVEAEFLAFEMLTFSSSYLGTQPLAAQGVLATITALTFQVPFALGIATCTRVAHHVGAGLASRASIAADVGLILGVAFGLLNSGFLVVARFRLAAFFTKEQEVTDLIVRTIWICAFNQVLDGVACVTGGIIRGQGRQWISAYVQTSAYYVIALPLSLVAAFFWRWGLNGLWFSVAVALLLISSTQVTLIKATNWLKVVEEARLRMASPLAGSMGNAAESGIP